MHKDLSKIQEVVEGWSYTTDGKVFNSRGRRLGSYTNKYGRIFTKYGTVTVSRALWFMHTGYWPEGEIDHIDGDTHNDSLDNLRDCPRKSNAKNRRSYKNSKSKYKGVYKQSGKYLAHIRDEGSHYYLGSFDTEKEAAEEYNRACLFYHGEYATLNKIEE